MTRALFLVERKPRQKKKDGSGRGGGTGTRKGNWD